MLNLRGELGKKLGKSHPQVEELAVIGYQFILLHLVKTASQEKGRKSNSGNILLKDKHNIEYHLLQMFPKEEEKINNLILQFLDDYVS
ncbi:MAG: hypothetical protein PHS44_02715 [Candidatus Dojkabacteria bacterium]|jgi:hypothetical protein|nr:hypothetical protein [Candidatus Dojkabacteria bacterium]